VTARLTTGASINVASLSSFVIVDPGVPQSTLLYQNFPNPFPSATSEFTCVWFDLATISPVRLEVFDLRGRPVRTLLPESGEFAFLNPGRHGRTVGPGGGTGCNGTIRWDGRGRDGAIVPAGVYLLRLRADGINLTRRVVFLGGM
jgi:hypothetical protein